MILLSNIPEELADKCLPFKFANDEIKYLYLHKNHVMNQWTSKTIEVIETIEERVFFIVDSSEMCWNDLLHADCFEYNLGKYLDELEIDIMFLYFFKDGIFYQFSVSRYKIIAEMNVFDFLKHTGIYED